MPWERAWKVTIAPAAKAQREVVQAPAAAVAANLPIPSETGFRRKGRTALLVLFLASIGFGADADRSLDFKYMHYRDKNGTVNHTPAFSLFTLLTRTLGLQWDQELDAVTGASRRLGLRNIGPTGGNDSLLDGVSGASRREWRHSEKATLVYENRGWGGSAGLYYSDEDDYTSLSPSLAAQGEFNRRNTNVSVAWSGFYDDLHPRGEFDHLGGKRQIHSFLIAVSQLVSPLSLFSLSANPIRSSGALGHPYTPVITEAGALLEESLPARRFSLALTGLWVQGYRWADRVGSVHAEFRRTDDDWGLVSHTGELQWHQYLTEAGGVRLRLRRYQQGAADFYRDLYRGDEAYRTADIRYSAFSSWTIGFKAFVVNRFGRGGLWPSRWDVGFDWGIRDTRGEWGTGMPARHYQVFDADEYYQEGTFMAGFGYDW